MWQWEWLNLVDKFGTNASGATWWPNFKFLQVVPQLEVGVQKAPWFPVFDNFNKYIGIRSKPLDNRQYTFAT